MSIALCSSLYPDDDALGGGRRSHYGNEFDLTNDHLSDLWFLKRKPCSKGGPFRKDSRDKKSRNEFLHPFKSPTRVRVRVTLITSVIIQIKLKKARSEGTVPRIVLNIDGFSLVQRFFSFSPPSAPIASTSHTHASHSQTSRLSTSSLSLGVPVPHVTQCIRDV